MSEMTPERRAEIRARANAATLGPWLQTHNISSGVKIWPSEHGSPPLFSVCGGLRYSHITDDDPVPQWQKDADFVRCARSDVPDLLAELDAAIARAEATERELEATRADLRDMTAKRDAEWANALEARRTLAEWRRDYGPLIAQSRQHITTEDADVPVRAADRDDLTMTLPLPDGGKDGAR